ncbi:MAG TPA: prolipoprotein diacylglyceryl transferase family protein [Polyangiaceae bacterium]|nr:prolipoprotein diacylglyceryl transferase family protein [Polyangiaceae bacterium]
MHPLLFHIPFPSVPVHLAPAFCTLAVMALATAALGRRAGERDLIVLGAAAFFGAVLAALRFRGQTVALGPLPVYTFGALLSAAIGLGFVTAVRLGERDGLRRDVIAGTCVVAATFGVIGARVLYVVTNLSDFDGLGDVLSIRSGGLTFYGGVLGGFGASLIYLMRRPGAWRAVGDALAPSLALGAMVGRFGCYFAGCDYGVPLSPSAPRWLARLGTFPRWPEDVAGAAAGSPAWLDHVLHRGLSLESTASLPVHPTQLYEVIAFATLFASLSFLRSRRSFRGELLLAFLVGYGVIRLLLETVRDDPERGLYGPHGPESVLVSLAWLLLVVAFAWGPCQSIKNRRVRVGVEAIALSSVLVIHAVLARRLPSVTQLSTSQWIAVLSGVGASLAWKRLETSPHIVSDGPPKPVLHA